MIQNKPAEIVELLNDCMIVEEEARDALAAQGLGEKEIEDLLEGHQGLTWAEAAEQE